VDITHEQEQVIIGSVLGDGYISGRYLRLEMGHGLKQYEYLKWKNSILCNLTHYSVPGKNDKSCWVTTKCFQEIKKYRKMFYDEHKKIPDYAIEKIGPLGLAVWYMDDGSFNGSRAIICCESFEPSSNLLIQKVIMKKFGIKFLHSKSDNRLFLSKYSEIKKFFDLIEPHIHSTMKYKVALKERKHQWRPDVTPESVREFISGNKTTKDAAQHFGVSTRTIQRRLNAL
jgi:recombination protein RecA